ncbi:MAG: metal ABC transporter solute-binding protein, Zn/Mn family [Magnetovibrionaceae bacterium]
MKKLFSGLLVAGLTLAAAFPAAAHDDRLKVVASFSILGDMVSQVTGDLADVTTIVGPDADAHVYTPNASDAKAVAGAEVIFVNGLGFETWSQTLIEISGTRASVFVATRGVEPLLVDGKIDPHAWNALTNGVIYVDNIVEGLAKADPDHAKAYKANAEAYKARLMGLHNKALAELAKLPAGQRTVVTAHDAFGYLAKAYGLTFLAPVGIDTEAEPSARDMAVLIDNLKQVGAGALFVENIASPALIEQISRETGIKIGGRIFSDALSARGGPATSYEAMFEHNLNRLISALSARS